MTEQQLVQDSNLLQITALSFYPSFVALRYGPIILPLLIPVLALRKAKFNIYDPSELSIIGEFLGETAPHLKDFSLIFCTSTLRDTTKNINAIILLHIL